MTRYAIDAPSVLGLIRHGVRLPEADRLVGPTLLRSDALALLYRAVRAGELDERDGRETLAGLAALRIRLLGDRVSRATAWRIAADLGWDALGPAEYLAVATLQADLLVTDDPLLASAADGLVPVLPLAALLARAARPDPGTER